MSNNNLNNLIKSLNMSEKRYISLASDYKNIGSQKKHLFILGLYLDNSDLSDEDLIESLKFHDFEYKYIADDKNYVYEYVLKQLSKYFSKRSISLRIKQNQIEIEILFNKGLYKECLKLIRQTEKMIDKVQENSIKLDLLVWKRRCLGYSFGLRKAMEVIKEQKQVLQQINRTNNLLDAYYFSYELKLKGDNIKNEIIEELFKTNLEKIKEYDQKNLNIHDSIYFELFYSHYYYLKSEFHKEYKYLKATVDLVDKNEHYKNEFPMEYIAIYNRFLAQAKFFNPNVFRNKLENFRNYKTKQNFNPDVITQRIFIHSNLHELEFLFVQSLYKEAENKIQVIEDEIKKYHFPIEHHYLIQLYFLFAIVHFTIRKHQKSLDYINYIINHYKLEDNPSIYSRTLILKSLIHFELGNYSIVKSVNNVLIFQYSKFIEKFELIFIKIIQKIISSPKNIDASKIKKMLDNFVQQNPPEQIDSLQSKNILIGYLNFTKYLLTKKI